MNRANRSLRRSILGAVLASLAVLMSILSCSPSVPVTDEMRADALEQIAQLELPDHGEWELDKTDRGVKYVELVAGDGITAEPGDDVDVHYNLWLRNGSLIDSTRTGNRHAAFGFVVGRGSVIEGWDDMVQHMSKGSIVLAEIPPKLGYGRQAVGPIPKNSTLIFSIELVRIR